RHEILKSSSARVLEEVLRMLESGSSGSFIHLMTEHGLLQMILPVLAEFLETEDGKEIYSYLQEVDTTFHEPSITPLQRPLLVSCLLWPIFVKRISIHFEERGRHPHLGEIYQEAQDLIEEIFRTFLNIPRRLKMEVASILTSQYRLTPLEKRRSPRLRIPHDPDFPLALRFLQIRAALEPGLQLVWQEWSEAITSPLPVRSTRRRRRRPAS
ncbi:MAG: hypothetical protein ACHQT8_05745, partial [Chlamydiales bacterium]